MRRKAMVPFDEELLGLFGSVARLSYERATAEALPQYRFVRHETVTEVLGTPVGRELFLSWLLKARGLR